MGGAPPGGAPPLPPGQPPLPPGQPALPPGRPPLPPGRPPLPRGPAPDAAVTLVKEATVPLQFLVDGYCTRNAELKTKGSTRHVLIRDLGKVATALKVKMPPLSTPSALFS